MTAFVADVGLVNTESKSKLSASPTWNRQLAAPMSATTQATPEAWRSRRIVCEGALTLKYTTCPECPFFQGNGKS